jgi:curli biogenesis system outer membrane secretion channel CsgG
MPLQAQALRESEPNNDYRSGNHIPTNTDIVGSLQNTQDIDFYVITLDDPGTLQLRFVAPKGIYHVTVYNHARTSGADTIQINQFSANGTETAAPLNVQAGIYSIRVSDFDSASGGPNYTLRVIGPQTAVAQKAPAVVTPQAPAATAPPAPAAAAPQAPAAAAVQQVMNNDSVIKLIQAGLSEDFIVSTINASPGEYDTSVDGLIALKGAGVGEKMLAVIMAKAASAVSAAPSVAAAAPVSNTASSDSRPRIAILEIPAAAGAYNGWRGWYGERANEVRASNVLRDLFTTEIVEQGTGRIRVVERAQIEAIRGEQAFGQSDEVDTATAVNVGKLLGVRYMLTGKITRFAQKKSSFSSGWGVGRLVGAATGSRTAGAVAGSIRVGNASFEGRLDMRVIDVQTGEIVAVAADDGDASNVSISVAGASADVQYDDTIVSDVFEPIVKKITPKLVTRLLNAAN